jgi:integrase
MVREDIVIDYFYDGEKELRGADYLQMIKSSIKVLADTVQNVDFSLLFSLLPQKKSTKKIYPALSVLEIEKIKILLYNDSKNLITKRDRAIVMIAMYTGLRGCDIASLSINDINRGSNELHIVQKKNGEELELTILPCVSNAIYDYIINERPKHKNRFIFLTSDKDTRPITPQAVRLLAQKFFRIAGVRTDGGRILLPLYLMVVSLHLSYQRYWDTKARNR